MRKTNAIILSAIAAVLLSAAPSAVYAQSKGKTATTNKKPTWITKAPAVKNTYIGIASVPKRSMNPDGEKTDNGTAQQSSSIIVSQLFFNDKYKESGRREAEKKILASLRRAKLQLHTVLRRGQVRPRDVHDSGQIRVIHNIHYVYTYVLERKQIDDGG